ncbi:MAG: CvpA family protein [Brevinematales bacterium]|nr:CvpA family protein [Brevinematales bacterium]
MNILDVILMSLVVMGIIWGAKKGFIGIFVLVIGIIVTIVLIDAFATPLSSFFKHVGVAEEYSFAIAVLSMMFVSLIVFFIVYILLKNLIDLFRIGVINRLLGVLVGGWVVFLLFGAVLFFLTKIPFIGFKKYVDNSLVARYSYEHAVFIVSLSGSEDKIEDIIEGEEQR